MACRDIKKAEKIISDLAVTHPNSKVKFLELNLESFASVKKFASDFKLGVLPRLLTVIKMHVYIFGVLKNLLLEIEHFVIELPLITLIISMIS